MAAVTIAGWLLGDPPSGYSTIMMFSAFTAASQFALLGILGEYVGQLVEEAKGRPVYIVARRSASSQAVALRRVA